MDIGSRLKQLRELKKFSQGEIERRTGLLRCYTSRVENGHTVPSVETLAKFAQALEVPIYQLFVEDDSKPIQTFIPTNKKTPLNREQTVLLKQIANILPKIDHRNGKILLSTAKQMARA